MENYSINMNPIEELKWLSERAQYLFSSIEADYKNAKKLNADMKNATKLAIQVKDKAQVEKDRIAQKIERKNRICSYCGSEKYYAKGLCASCYHRYLRNGTVEYKPKKVKLPTMSPSHSLKPHWTHQLTFDVVGQTSDFPADLEESIYAVLDTLTPKQKQVILMRYRDEQTLASCKDVFGVTREWIRQIQIKAISELKKPARICYFTLGVNGICKKGEVSYD